jgi:hypothetical protein
VLNSDRLYKFDPAVVFKRFRVCRNHFAADCFNGQCKKLLPTAVPSLHISTGSLDRLKTKYQMYEQKVVALLKNNSVNIEHDALSLISIDNTQQETLILNFPEDTKLPSDDKLWNSAEEENDNEEYTLMEVVDDGQENQSFTIVKLQENVSSPPKVLNYQKSPAVDSGPIAKKNSVKPKLTIRE